MGLTWSAARISIDELPPQLLMEILSYLSWRQQLVVRRVSRSWRTAADACLVRRRELYISAEDLHTGLNAERLLSLLQSMPALRRFSLDDCYPDSGELLAGDPLSVDQLCDSCPQLQTVNLECKLDDADVETLLRRLPGLRSLHLKFLEAEGDCLSLLPSGLQSLSLSNDWELSPDSFRHLTRCSRLRELDLSDTKLCDEELAAALIVSPQLERLTVTGCYLLTGDWLTELRRCPQLRELIMPYVNIRSDQLAAAVTACPKLERLAVLYHSLKADWLPQLRNCPQLQELDISHLDHADLDLSVVLIACSQLKRLRVDGIRNPLLTFPFFLTFSDGLPGLTHLDLSASSTDDATFSRLPDLLPGLRDLRLNYCPSISTSQLASVLLRLTNLQVLDMDRTLDDLHDQYYNKICMVSLLSTLPLKALSYVYTGDPPLSYILWRWPSLTAVRLKDSSFSRTTGSRSLYTLEGANRIAADLVRHPLPVGREVTLIVPEFVFNILVSKLPKNFRLLRNRLGIWGTSAGWTFPDSV